ncbi:MAG: NADH-quinone oxidoreductase subunit [Bacillota bacterium]|jgi:NADH-quinone oxidoreductase subunit F|nr:NADH-quinone oxidoreductase subunit [Bacillota bacterium]
MGKAVSILTKNLKNINIDTIDDYLAAGGYEGLKKVLTLTPTEVIEKVKNSGLKGRGGAAFPTGKKWEEAAKVKEDSYILCNADEGEPGTFKDRYFLEFDPYRIIEGMTIAAYAVGGREGYIYIREEYGKQKEIIIRAIDNAKARGLLGNNILDSDICFNIKVISGAGAFICGETTALIQSIEGGGGRPKIKFKRTAESGLFGKPTLANNIESYCVVTTLFTDDAEQYLSLGTDESRGTKVISLCGNVENPGVYEVPFGITLREIIYDIGGGIKDGRDFKFAQIGGASGPIIPKSMMDLKYSYEDFKKEGYSIGSGAVLVADDTNSVADFMVTVQEFFVHESCGKCTPCREGNRQLLKIAHKVAEKKATQEDLITVKRVANVMKNCSFCGLGTAAPTVMVTAIQHFYDMFD